MGLRGDEEEGYAFQRLEDAQQAELLCVALELFSKLKKAAPPSSGRDGAPFSRDRRRRRRRSSRGARR